MLTLLCGRSGSGKTKTILARLARGAERGAGNRVLLVPEQYSHEAERELTAALGDSASLYAEVLSFTRLASRVAAERGGLADAVPDKGAKLLMLSLAAARVASRLTICGGRSGRAGHLENILRAVEELDNAEISDDSLLTAAESSSGPMAEKLRDLALIREAYAQVRSELLSDPRDLMTRLAERLPLSDVGSGGVFIDGFTDFTGQELEILDCFLRRNVDMTVTLACDGSGADEFSICEKTKGRLADMAARRGVACELLRLSAAGDRPPELAHLEKALTEYGLAPFDGGVQAVELYAMSSPSAELSLAAARILELMQADPTLRRRDFTVAARNFAALAPTAESVFRQYGLAAYSGRREDILQKPLMRLAVSALDTVTGGWRYADVFSFLKTGLSGLSAGEVDILENYCLTWDIRGSSVWNRPEPWSMNPQGYVSGDADTALLERLDDLRRRAAAPLFALQNALKAAPTVGQKARALWELLDSMGLDRRLAELASEQRSGGDAQSADETAQLWNILIGAIEQLDAVAGTLEMDDEEFARHFRLLLTQYDVGTIPASLDAVTLCELDAVRARRTRCLIVVGTTADAMPASPEEGGVFSLNEREKLAALGIDLGGDGDEAVCRELYSIYAALTAASEKLIITWSEDGDSRPSFIVQRIAASLGIKPITEASLGRDYLTRAALPCLWLAASRDGPLAASAASCIGRMPGLSARLDDLSARVSARRGSLSDRGVTAIYGDGLNISASRAEGLASCHFNYFLKYGLRAEPRKKAAFDAPEFGTFVHYILENVTREAGGRGGFAALTDEDCAALADKYIDLYTRTVIASGKRTGRFMYLFSRLRESVRRIVADIASELRNSDFQPLDFELRFADGADMPPEVISRDGLDMRVRGIVDRVDGWTDGDRLYIRVNDYKTGRKSFSLSDVWYGLGLQMLIYLFVLAEHGEKRYGKSIVPAGVMYLPARDMILSMPKSSSDEAIAKKRGEQSLRTGLAVDDRRVLDAMEKSPARLRFTGRSAPVTLVSAQRLGSLAKYIEELLTRMGKELLNGRIDADPRVSGGSSFCEYCEYAEACGFDESRDKARRLRKITDEEFWQHMDEGGVYDG